MRVLEIWRYGVKSLQGERLQTAELTDQGVEGDRRFALVDVATGMGLTARRAPALLMASARMTPSGDPEITLPDGSVTSDDADLSRWLGRPVALVDSDSAWRRRYENPDDAEDEAGGWDVFEGAEGAFHDSGEARVTAVSTATLGDWDRRRFRANLVVDGEGEDDLVGRRVRVGGAELEVGMQVERCVMVTRPQPDGIDRDLSVLREVHRRRGGMLAVGAHVVVPGRVSVGDVLEPVPS